MPNVNLVIDGTSISSTPKNISDGTIESSLAISTDRTGVGTTIPARKLHVYDSSAGSGTTYQDDALLVLEKTLNAGLNILAHDSICRIDFGDNADPDVGGITYDHEQGIDKMTFITNAAARLTIDNIGRTGIGVTAPSAKLHIVSDQEIMRLGSDLTQYTRLFISPTGNLQIRKDYQLDAYSYALDLQNRDTGSVLHKTGILFSFSINGETERKSAARIMAMKEQLWTPNPSTQNSAVGIETLYKNALSEKMRVTSEGRIGVGTTLPGAKLEIKGATSDDTASALKITDSSSKNLIVLRNDGRLDIGHDTSTNPSVIMVPSPTGTAVTDRTNIQAAINDAANNGGGTVLLQKGTYKLEAYTDVSQGGHKYCIQIKEGVQLIGAGANATILDAGDSDCNVIESDPAAYDTQWRCKFYITMRDFCVKAGVNSMYSTGQASRSGDVITGYVTTFSPNMVGCIMVFADGTTTRVTEYTDATHLKVADSGYVALQDYGIGYKAIYLRGVRESYLENITVNDGKNFYYAFGTGIHIQGWVNTLVGCWVYDSLRGYDLSFETDTGAHPDSTSAVSLHGCHYASFGLAGPVNGCYLKGYSNSFYGCTFEKAKDGETPSNSVALDVGIYSGNTVITGCHFEHWKTFLNLGNGCSFSDIVDSHITVYEGYDDCSIIYNYDTGLTSAHNNISNIMQVRMRYSGGTWNCDIGKEMSIGNGISTSLTVTDSLKVSQPTIGPGTVTTNGTTALTGIGTKFTNTFKVGDTITVRDETARTIDSISSDTSLTVTSAFSSSQGGLTYTLTGGDRLCVKGNWGRYNKSWTSPRCFWKYFLIKI